jgi:hypothetical protein
VAGLSAIVFVLPVLFESHIMGYFRSYSQQMAANIIITELKLYFFFAFAVSLIREIDQGCRG